MKRKEIKELKERVNKRLPGCMYVEHIRSKNHVKVWWEYNGRRRFTTCSNSSSDKDRVLNNRVKDVVRVFNDV